MKRTFTLFFVFILLAFLVLSPSIIADGLNKNVYSIREEKRKDRFRGNMEVWHVVSFKTREESGVSYLKNIASAFEKNNPYLYITVRGLTIGETETLLKSGEIPDVISFPLGFSVPELSELEAAESLLPPFENAGTENGKVYAYPYMFDYYKLLINQDIFYESDIPLPFSAYLTSSAFYSALDAFKDHPHSLSFAETEGLYPFLSLLYPVFEEDDVAKEAQKDIKPISQYPFELYGKDAFLSGQATMYLSTAAEAARLSASSEASFLSISEYAVSSYTDAVELIGVPKKNDEKKMLACKEFASLLLTPKRQREVLKTGLLPTTKAEALSLSGIDLEEWESFSKKGYVPNTFVLCEAAPEIKKLGLSVSEKFTERLFSGQK